MRKKKDMELTTVENQKIEKLEQEIQEKNEQLGVYQNKAGRIERKVHLMKKYDDFLERVKDNNQDEFAELQDILSRYKQLQGKNEELHETQDTYTTTLDHKTKELTQFRKDMETQMITINNRMSQQMGKLEHIEKQKQELLATRDESTKQKSKMTTETGRMLMTIENLFAKCVKERAEMITSTKDYKDWEKVRNFDNTTISGKKAVEQIKIIQQVVENFKDLMHSLENHPNQEIRQYLEMFRNGEDIKKKK
jgi:chromosome segregation ATPase